MTRKSNFLQTNYILNHTYWNHWTLNQCLWWHLRKCENITAFPSNARMWLGSLWWNLIFSYSPLDTNDFSIWCSTKLSNEPCQIQLAHLSELRHAKCEFSQISPSVNVQLSFLWESSFTQAQPQHDINGKNAFELIRWIQKLWRAQGVVQQ